MGNLVNFFGISERSYNRSIVEQKNPFYNLPISARYGEPRHPGCTDGIASLILIK
jgi:hypothetical protein